MEKRHEYVQEINGATGRWRRRFGGPLELKKKADRNNKTTLKILLYAIGTAQ